MRSFFIDQDTALKNDEIASLGQLELICEIYDLYNNFVRWIKRCGTAKRSYGANELFHHKLSHLISDLYAQLDPHDERLKALPRLFGDYEKLRNAFPQQFNCNKNAEEKENAPLNETLQFHKEFKATKDAVASNPAVKLAVKNEFTNFCCLLLKMLTKQGKSASLRKKFIAKLIDYISQCVNSQEVNMNIVKYILTAFIEIIKMSGTGLESEEKNEKRQMLVLKTLDKLRLTKTILTLLYSEEFERLNSIMPLVFRLSNKILIGALPEIQKQFFNEFETNPRSERLFERMYAVISRNIFVYHNHPDKFALHFAEPSQKIFGTIDSESEILTLLKLLCENHNEDLQLYMNGKKLAKKGYSMVDIIVKYLNVLIEEIKSLLEGEEYRNHLSREVRLLRMRMSYKHAILAMTALIEFVQGPCIKNQYEISYTNFFNIAQNIMSLKFLFDDTIKEYQKELSNNYEISELKMLCAILLLSIIEQRPSTDSLTLKMRLSLSEESILYNIQFIYFAFMKDVDGSYTEDLLFVVRVYDYRIENKGCELHSRGRLYFVVCSKEMV